MVESTLVLRSLAMAFLIFSVKKPFSSNIPVCFSLCVEKADETKPLYICESLFQSQTSKTTYLKPMLALQILLLLAGNIKICPGQKGAFASWNLCCPLDECIYFIKTLEA